MTQSSPLEWRKDFIGERLYASRNGNDVRQITDRPTCNRAQVDWNLTLRQVRKNHNAPTVNIGGSASLPNLHTQELAEGEGRAGREPQTSEHHDGGYHRSTATVGKYQNFASASHMISGRTRVSSGTSHQIDWQLNLRDGIHQKPDEKWRRYFTRPQRSFDMMKENCSKDNEAYQKSRITPQDRRPDRREGCITIETIRSNPLSFKRWKGCEGTQVGLWEHLISDRSHGHKSRRQLQHETSMREEAGDTSGGRITDNRTDGCLVEMLGKKKWFGSTSHEPLAARPPVGDPRLYHLSKQRLIPEKDEDSRKLRLSRTDRTDNDISDQHVAKGNTKMS